VAKGLLRAVNRGDWSSRGSPRNVRGQKFRAEMEKNRPRFGARIDLDSSVLAVPRRRIIASNAADSAAEDRADVDSVQMERSNFATWN